jgi:hypothetical protein
MLTIQAPGPIRQGYADSRQEEGLHHISSSGGVISKQLKLQGGPAALEPIHSIPGFGFDSSGRNGDELFSGGEVCLAATLMPYVRDSAQFFDSNTATSRDHVQGHSCVGGALENVELFDCPVGLSFA